MLLGLDLLTFLLIIVSLLMAVIFYREYGGKKTDIPHFGEVDLPKWLEFGLLITAGILTLVARNRYYYVKATRGLAAEKARDALGRSYVPAVN